MRCPSCHGVVGVDCFNTSECAWIERQQQVASERQEQNPWSDEFYIQHLESLLREAAEYIEPHTAGMEDWLLRTRQTLGDDQSIVPK